MLRRALVLLVLALAVVLAGCGTDDEGSGDGTPGDTTQDDSSGTTEVPGDDATPMQPPAGPYEVTSLEIDGEVHENVPGTTIRIEFSDGQVNVHAGCNHLRAKSEFDGTAVTIEQVGGTEMGCDQPRMDQDELLGEFLPGRWEVEGSEALVLTADGKKMELTPIVETDQALVGPTWKLTSILDGDTAASAPNGVRATLAFDKTGSVTFNDGCNTGGGEVEVSGSTLVFGDLMTTLKACAEPGRRRTQTAYAAVLKDEVDFTIDGDTLTLTKGKAGLEFTAP